jgi:hypothetical protein
LGGLVCAFEPKEPGLKGVNAGWFHTFVIFVHSKYKYFMARAWQKECEYPGEVRIGSTDKVAAQKVQEWINLHKFHTKDWRIGIKVDGDPGECTDEAIRAFQTIKGLPATGVVDELTWSLLVQPMRLAFTFNDQPSMLAQCLNAFAKNMVKQHPTELTNNRGPWVRAFMHGKEWDTAYWCAGYVCTLIEEACKSLGKDMAKILPYSMSVPELMHWAMKGVDGKGNPISARYYHGVTPEFEPKAGDIGIVLDVHGAAQHIFIVTGYNKVKHMVGTNEGNTNDEGSANGYEACERFRKVTTMMGFIRLE